MLLVALGLAGITVTFLLLNILPATLTSQDRMVVRKVRLQAGSARQEELGASLAERLVMPWFTKAANRLLQATPAARLHALEARLNKAGLYGRQPMIGLAGAKFGLAVLGVLAGLLVQPLYGILGAGVGFVLPEILLQQRIKKRQQAITLAMPDAMDLMAVSVEAGLTLDAAFKRLVSHENKSTHDLSQEVRLFLKDVQLGRPRREAFKELGQRAGVRDLQLLTTALYQAEAWGVEMAKVMRVQADHLRVRRLQRAEEQAMKAPIKILFPLAFCIFPAIFVVLLGPAGLRLMTLFRG